MKKETKKQWGRLKDHFLNFDNLGQPINFNINGKDTHRTCLGSLLFLIIAGLTLSYTTVKFRDMYNYNDTSFQQTREKIKTETVA